MILVADTGGILALYDSKDRHHAATRKVLDTYEGSIVVPTSVVSELDYLLSKYLGPRAALDFLYSVEAGAFGLEQISDGDLTRSIELLEAYSDLQLGFVDASVIAVAERLKTREILTIDQRDFRAVGSHRYGTLILRPFD